MGSLRFDVPEPCISLYFEVKNLKNCLKKAIFAIFGQKSDSEQIFFGSNLDHCAVQDDQRVPGHEMSFVERSKHFNQQVAKNPALMFSFNTKAKAYGYDPKSPKVMMFRLLNVSMNVYIAWWLYTWLTSEDDKEDQVENAGQKTAIKSLENDISIYGQIAQQKQQYQQQSLQNSQVGQQYQTYATLEKQQDSDFETYKSGKSDR